MGRAVAIAVTLFLAASSVYAWMGPMMVGGPGRGSPLFSDGFETGDFSLWGTEVDSGSDLSVISTPPDPYAGTYEMSCRINDQTAFYVPKDLGQNYSEVWIHFYIRFNEVSNASVATWATQDIFTAYPTGGGAINYANIRMQVNDATPRAINYIRGYYKDGAEASQSFGGTITVAADTWYEVKARYVRGTSADGIIQIWWNGSQVINQTALTMSSSTYFGLFRLGNPQGVAWGAAWTTVIYYIDGFAFAESDIW